MPKIARQHATHVETMAGFEGHYQDPGGYATGCEACTQGAGPAPLFRGSPGDRGRVTGAAAAVASGAGVRSGQAGQELLWREVRLLGGGIAEDPAYCTGIWGGPGIARSAAGAPRVWR